MNNKFPAKNEMFSSQLAVKAYLLFMLVIVMIAAFEKPTQHNDISKQPVDIAIIQPPALTIEQQIDTTVTRLSALLQNNLHTRVREKVAMQLLLADASVVLRDCNREIANINKKYLKQDITSGNDLFIDQIMKNIFFQETMAVRTDNPQGPKIIMEHLITNELRENLKRYTLIINTLSRLNGLGKNAIQKFDEHLTVASYELAIVRGDFENMQSALDHINEVHERLNQIVNAM